MKKTFEEVLNNLVKQKIGHWEPDEVEEYLSHQEFEFDENLILRLLECLVEDDIWKWLKYIGYKLPEVASTEERFIELVEKIAGKVRGDMAQGPFIGALIDIGLTNPKLGFALFQKMTGKEGLIFYSSFPLGGAGRTDFEKAFHFIKEGTKSSNSELKAASIRALRVIFEKEEKPKKSAEIFEILKNASNKEENIVVRNEVANAYIDFNKFDPKECTDNLIRLANQGDSSIRLNLAYSLQTAKLVHGEDVIKILKICSEDDDERVLKRVSIALAFNGKEYPEDTLEIVKNWVKRGKYFDVSEIEYCLQEIGKGYLDRCIKVVEDWIENEKDERFQFFIPIILKEMCSSNYGQLMGSVRIWSQRDGMFQKMAIKTIRAVLTEIFPPKTENKDLVDSSFSILEEMAKKRGLNIETIIKGETEEFFQCFRLIEELELKRPELDFEKIFTNLENYPTIKEFLCDEWFQKKRKKNNRMHPLLIILSYEPSSKLLRPVAFLNHLEEMLKIVVSKSKKLKDLRDGLGNEDQFWQTVSEIEIIASFMKEYPVEIAPEIDTKKLDAMINIDGRELLIEVINPEMFKPLRYLTGKTMGIENRARDKIYDEFKKHLKDVYLEEKIPVIIVIDIERSEIGYDFVEDYLMGTLQLVMLFDKKRGEAVKTYPARAKDYMHALDEETNVLSAVLCYRRRFGKDHKFHFEGRIIPNKYAKNPLSQELIEKIKEALFIE